MMELALFSTVPLRPRPVRLPVPLHCIVLVNLAWLCSGSHAQELEFRDLFNGKDLAGWTQRNGTATYRVEGNTIVGRTSEGSPNSFLCTDKPYGDFELKFDVKVDRALNSGVQIRSQSVGDTPDGRVNGPQVEISLDGMAGYIYGESAGGWMTPDKDRKGHQRF